MVAIDAKIHDSWGKEVKVPHPCLGFELGECHSEKKEGPHLPTSQREQNLIITFPHQWGSRDSKCIK